MAWKEESPDKAICFFPAEMDGPLRGTSLRRFGDILLQIVARGSVSRMCAACRV